MMRCSTSRAVKRLVWIAILTLSATSCHKNQQAEGPLERAGKKVDRAADETGVALKSAADKTGQAAKRAADETGKALEKAGQKLQGNERARRTSE